MNPYGNYYGDPAVEPRYDDFGSAAIYVGVMIATAAVVLYVLRKSGFRAMIAVGGGG